MINRTPMNGMNRGNQQGGRAGVHYGRNPHLAGPRPGAGGEHSRQNIAPPRAQPAAAAVPEPTYENAAETQALVAVPLESSPKERAAFDSAPESLRNQLFIPGFLRTQIGRTVHAEFLIGVDIIEERMGTLTDVGANYIILQEVETRNQVLCDIHSIKFITVCDERY